MPIGFRCTGCRSRLHVPKRWAGNTLLCPKCGTRVVVPAATSDTTDGPGEGHQATAFEDRAVERSLASLEVPAVRKPGGIFAEDSFELPPAEDFAGAVLGRYPGAAGITLSRWAIYAYLMLVPAVAFAAFRLGCWWHANGGR
jgi:DNA-directed RNA polymerase subunit RPC12/RpoP